MSEVINPNIPTTGIHEPVQQVGGDAPVSFDELESALSKTQTQARESKAKDEAQSAKPPAKDKDGAKQQAKTKENSDGRQEKGQEGQVNSKPQSGKEKGSGDDSEPVKLIPVKIGEESQEWRADARVPVKIDGKEQLVSLADLRNGYSGQRHLQQQYTSLKQEKETFYSERKDLDSAIQTVHDLLVTQKDLRGCIEYLSGALGADPKKVYQDTVAQIEKQISDHMKLSPEEQQSKRVQDELEYYKKRDEIVRQQGLEQKEVKLLENRAFKVMESQGIDKETFAKRYDELVATGQYQDITPEMIGLYHQNLKVIETVEKSIEELAPDLENKADEIARVAKEVIEMKASPAEITEILSQLYGNQAERKLSKKISKMEKTAQAQIGRTPRNPGKDPMFFDDLG